MSTPTVITKDLTQQASSCTKIDRFGAIASAICAVHCFLTSIALGALSIAGLGFLGSTATDIVFVVIAVCLGSFAVRSGYKHHKSYLPFAIFATGLLMVFISHFVLGHTHEHGHNHIHEEEGFVLAEAATTFLAVGGGVMLMSFHIVNARLQRKAKRKLRCCCH